MTETAYAAWLNEQTEWMNGLEKAYRKTCSRYIVIVLIVTTVAMFALGVLVSGILIGLQNAFFGLILGLIISLFCMAAFSAKAPRKCYLKSLKKEISKEFPTEFEREQFARQMQEAAQNIYICSWEQSGGRSGKVEVTKEYAVRFSDNSVTVVKLTQVERMELDAYVDTISVQNEFGTVRRRQGNFIIRFFYYQTETAAPKKKTVDKRFNLPSKELRDKVAERIQSQ